MTALDQIAWLLGLRGAATGQTGLSAGDPLRGTGAWMQGFGGRARQGERDGVYGYHADLYGIAVGADRAVAPGLRKKVRDAASADDEEADDDAPGRLSMLLGALLVVAFRVFAWARYLPGVEHFVRNLCAASRWESLKC